MGDGEHSGHRRRRSGDEYDEPDRYKRARYDRAGTRCSWLCCAYLLNCVFLSNAGIRWLLSP